MTTQIHLNVNDLVEQIIELTNKNNQAINESREATEKLKNVESELVTLQTEKVQARLQYEADLDDMAKHRNVSELDNVFSKISNG